MKHIRLIMFSILAVGFTDKAECVEPQPQIQKLRELDVSGAQVVTVSFSPDGHTLVKVRELQLPRGPVAALGFSPDGRTLVAEHVDHTAEFELRPYTKISIWTLPGFQSHHELDPKRHVGAF